MLHKVVAPRVGQGQSHKINDLGFPHNQNSPTQSCGIPRYIPHLAEPSPAWLLGLDTRGVVITPLALEIAALIERRIARDTVQLHQPKECGHG